MKLLIGPIVLIFEELLLTFFEFYSFWQMHPLSTI
uniref:Uncharacterized protein n=1 Tax=Rhizophora mucronata TaxID=61149 RepID=A0A2P2IZA5_RHIMU